MPKRLRYFLRRNADSPSRLDFLEETFECRDRFAWLLLENPMTSVLDDHHSHVGRDEPRLRA